MSRRRSKRSRRPKERASGAKPEPSQPLPAVSDRTAVRNRRLLIGCIAFVSLCVLAAHWGTLSARALCSDDLEYLVDNPLVKTPSWNSAERFLTEVLRPSTVGGYYQPLAMTSLMLDYAAGGREADPRAFHRTSLALHVVNTALIVLLMYSLFGNPLAAGLVGLLFGVHPMTVEPIPWISERKTLLAAFFALACLNLYVRYTRRRNWKLYFASLGVFVLAVMSKPTSTPLPVCLLLMDYWPLRRLRWGAAWEKVPFLLVSGISGFITFYSQRATFGLEMPAEHSPLRIPLILCHNIVFYLYKIVLPVNLSPHYPFPDPVGLSHPMVLTGVLGTLVLLVVLAVSFKYARGPLVGWLFFFVAILPTMGVIGFTVVVASDKFAYLPSVGLLMLVNALLVWLWSPWSARDPKTIAKISVATGLILVLAAFEMLATRRTAAHWKDTDTLNAHMLSLSPNAAWVHNCTAVNLIRTGRIGEAIEHLTRALELKGDYHEAHNSIAIAYEMTGRTDLAIRHLREAIKIKPSYGAARKNLAAILKRQAALKTAQTRPRN